MSEKIENDNLSLPGEVDLSITENSLGRVKGIVKILLENNTFLEEDLKFISLLSNNKYIAIISLDDNNIIVKKMSHFLETLIGADGLKNNIDMKILLPYLDHAIQFPGDEVFTNITIMNGDMYLNVVNSNNNTFEFYFINAFQHNEHIIDVVTHDINIINEIVGLKDNETFRHTRRVGELSSYLSGLMGYEKNFSDNLKLTAPLHDLGKIKIPDNILFNTGKLSKSEFKIIETHTTQGGKIVDKLKFVFGENDIFDLTKNIILYHHEKFDGSGYPEGLKGDEIPLEARIVAIVDVFDALKSKRPYKEPFDDDKVKQILSEGKGIHFDPEIFDVFIAHYYEMVGVRGLNEDIETEK